MESVTCTASPSLALVKYWGKKRNGLPATSSLAVTLGGLETHTTVRQADHDRISINGIQQDIAYYSPFLDRVRKLVSKEIFFDISSENNFPTAAGLASSSSGYAALAMGSVKAAGGEITGRALSELAGTGSRSAARAVFGGFVQLPANARYAYQVFPPEYWPQLRVLVVVVEEKPKEMTSRKAMTHSATSSPYYPSWVKSSRPLLKEALSALERRDIEALGAIARISYMRMHAAMMASNPPIRYWKPVSLAVQDVCEELRKRGTGAWETMDAGPQVKILCTAEDSNTILTELRHTLPDLRIIESFPGMGARITDD